MKKYVRRELDIRRIEKNGVKRINYDSKKNISLTMRKRYLNERGLLCGNTLLSTSTLCLMSSIEMLL